MATERSESIVYSVLDHFAPNRVELSSNYSDRADGKPFVNELEMIRYYSEHDNLSQTFYWSESPIGKDKLTVGADFTSDKHLIMTITLDGTEDLAVKYLSKLKSFLGSDCGFICFGFPGNYKTGAEFEQISAEVNVA